MLKKFMFKFSVYIFIVLAVVLWAYFDPNELFAKALCGFAFLLAAIEVTDVNTDANKTDDCTTAAIVVEWHDLEKNPDDLPNENMKQVIVMDCRDNYLMGWYCINRKTWYDNECPDEFDDKIKDVVKWKEIE